MIEQEIFAYLLGKGFNEYAVAGIMGNLKAESALRANNVEDRIHRDLGISDEDYVATVDNGTYGRFITDSYGFGYAQWTYWVRKQGLYAFAQERGVSIADPKMQLDYLCKELLSSEYRKCYNALKAAQSVSEASNAFLLEFERPYDHGEDVQAYRSKLGQEILSRCRNGSVEIVEEQPIEVIKRYPADMAVLCRGFYGSQVKAFQCLLCSVGYTCTCNGEFDVETENACKAFQSDYGLSVDGIAGKDTFNMLYGG